MSDFLFVVRTFLVTVVIFLGMQIRIGSRTIEQHSLAWVHSSSFIESLQNVSDGAVHVFHVAGHKVSSMFTKLPTIGASDAEGSHEAKRRVQKRVEARKAMSHQAIEAEPAKPAAKADESDSEKQEDERKTGSFRTFFDVKTVHDADSKSN